MNGAEDAGPRLTSPLVIRDILARHGLRAAKRFGQHFLTDSGVLKRIVECAELSASDSVVEIGPGLGTLTRELARRCGRVAAIERDLWLRPVLEETLAGLPNVTVMYGDALRILEQTPATALFGHREAVSESAAISCVSNLPYNITSPLITTLLKGSPLRQLALMIQAEVADRVTATPGTAAYGALTVFVGYHCRVERIAEVSPGCFTPAPRVNSAIVRLMPLEGGTVQVDQPDRLFQVSRALFGQRRKTCANALMALPDGPSRERVLSALGTVGLGPQRRGEEFSIAEMAAIANALPGLDEKQAEGDNLPVERRHDIIG